METKEAIKEIFEEIDAAIGKCQKPNPIQWNDSQFKKYYLQIKNKWLNGEIKE